MEEKAHSPLENGISVNVLAHTAKRLRAALQQMYSALDQLDRAYPEEDSTIDRTVSVLLQGIFRLERMADNLSSMQQLMSGEELPRPVQTDITRLLRKLLEKAEGLLDMAQIRLEWTLPETPFCGSMDERLLALVMWNLLNNAASHAEQGVVTVRVTRVRLSRLRIAVTDSGSGIPEEQMDELMRRYAVHPDAAMQQDGVGLGLSLAQQVAQRFGGSMALMTDEAGRTTTAIELRTDLPARSDLRTDSLVLVRSLDDGMVGLSDVLPRQVFDRRDIL